MGTLGPSHRDVARDLNNIAALLLSEGKNGEAEPLQRRTIAILEDLQRETMADRLQTLQAR